MKVNPFNVAWRSSQDGTAATVFFNRLAGHEIRLPSAPVRVYTVRCSNSMPVMSALQIFELALKGKRPIPTPFKVGISVPVRQPPDNPAQIYVANK